MAEKTDMKLHDPPLRHRPDGAAAVEDLVVVHDRLKELLGTVADVNRATQAQIADLRARLEELEEVDAELTKDIREMAAAEKAKLEAAHAEMGEPKVVVDDRSRSHKDDAGEGGAS